MSASEPYHKVNTAELPFGFSSAITRWKADSDGNTINVDGVIKDFSLDGRQIELETDKLTKIGNEVFILTKSYGKVKVTSDSNMRATLWLTPSQAEQFKALRRSSTK